tara:strand:+ start:157 stop:276 length:120 start_codon:yes stop_codon:yes gene_type:complete
MITIIINGKEYEFKGDDLTSPIHDAIAFLNVEQQKKMVV